MHPLVLLGMVRPVSSSKVHVMQLSRGSGDFQYLLLRTAERLGKNATGKQITSELALFLKREINPGQLYAIMAKLIEMRCITRSLPPDKRGHRREFNSYTVTEEGIRLIAVYRKKLAKLLEY
jgi:DNA-binding PadR family transcriptional regulator